MNSQNELLAPSDGPALANPEPELKRLGRRAEEFHAACLGAFRDHASAVFLCGAVLNRAKEICPHGAFGPWQKQHTPSISSGSAHNYMDFAKAVLAKFPTVGNLRPLKLLGRGEVASVHLDEGDQAAIAKAIHGVADGKTLTELYRELGVIREKKPFGGPSVHRKLTAEERLATATALANQLVGQVRAACGQFRAATELLPLANPSERAAMRRDLIDLGKACDQLKD